MAWVVFLRGVNVGGHKAFRPSALAKELAGFGAVNVGAAGTFVIRGPVSQRGLRAELLRRLPFEAEFMICPGRELAALASGDSFPAGPADEGAERFVSVLAKRPRTLRCRWCNSKIEIKPRGRVPEFCSQTCRQRAYEQRKWARPAAVEMVARDLATAKVREVVRSEAWHLLRQMGLVVAAEPPPTPKKPRKPTLRLVKPEPAEDT